MKIKLILFALIHSLVIYSQDAYKTKSLTHVFWQTENELKLSDFKGNGQDVKYAKRDCDSTNLCTVGAFGLFTIIDIPKRKRKRGILPEKIYIAPAFSYNKSYSIKNDSLGVKKQQLVFDIYELSARMLRKQLFDLSKKAKNSFGIYSIWLMSMKSDIMKKTNIIVDEYTKEVYIENVEGAYDRWRKLIDKELEKTKEYKTTKKECYRFVINKPIEKGYMTPKTIIGNLFE